MKKPLRKLLGIGALASLASFIPMKNAEAQVSGSVEYIQSEQPDKSYPRLNAFYQVPGEISGYTFVEFYKNDEGYFGRTMLDKSLIGRFGPRVLGIHKNNPLSEASVGISTTLPGLPEKSFVRLSFLPFWVGNEGRVIGDKAELQYGFRFNLPKGFRIGGFGIWDILKEDGGEWSYGEIEFTKSFGPVKIGYNPALRNDGDAIPRLEHRGIIGVNF